jgi:hypothetical protein
MATSTRSNISLSLRTRISSRTDAASQFLLILIGLGLTNAVTKFGQELDDPKNYAPFTAIFVFLVFVIYTVRFFFNNWIYLSESYRTEVLEDLVNTQPGSYLRIVLRCAHLDLLLSIITGASCAFAGTMLNPNGAHLTEILVLLIFHYFADLIILGHNSYSRRRESADEKFSRKRFAKVNCWLINNAAFCLIFLMLLRRIRIDNQPASHMITFTVLWLINSMLAVGISLVFGFLERKDADFV